MGDHDALSAVPLACSQYRRRGCRFLPPASTMSAESGAGKSDDIWEKLKSSGPPQDDDDEILVLRMGSLRQTTAPQRKPTELQSNFVEKKSISGGRINETGNSNCQFRASPEEPPSSSSSQTLPAKRKSSSDVYDFDLEEDNVSNGLPSSQGSSSQGSNPSTGSTSSQSRSKTTSDAGFRKPAPPPVKVKERAPEKLPAIKKGESFRPVKKRKPSEVVQPIGPKTVPAKPPTSEGKAKPPPPSQASSRSGTNPTSSQRPVGRPANDIQTAPKAPKLPTPPMPALEKVPVPVRHVSDSYDPRSHDGKAGVDILMKKVNATGNSLLNRCQGAVQLAMKLTDPSFRLEFFAHATTSVFDVMKDAASDPNLGLCFATVVLVLSTDNLKMAVDRKSLHLLSAIVEKGEVERSKLNAELLEDVYKVVAKSKFAKHLAPDVISAPRLVLEALMTMKLGSQLKWFMDEVRRQGLIEHVIHHFVAIIPLLEKKPTTSVLGAVHRISEFFYKIMHASQENSELLLSSCKSQGFSAVVSSIKFCVNQLKHKNLMPETRAEIGVVLRSLLSLLINLSGHADMWRSEMGACPGLMESLVQACFDLSGPLARDKAQEILIRALLCIVNLTYDNESNCTGLLKARSVSSTHRPNLLLFVELMKKTSDDAVTSGNDLDRCTEQYGKMIRSIEQDADVTITDVLDKAGENMEHYAIMCYGGLILGHLISHNEDAPDLLKTHFEAVFGNVADAVTVATDAITRMINFITDAKADKVHPIQEMDAAVIALETYKTRHS